MKTIAIVSGGMDSVTLAHLIAKRSQGALHVVSFDYGQRHKKELEYAGFCASYLNAQHSVVDLRDVTRLLKGSALTDGAVGVPEGHYTDASMKSTVVPNRNAIMLSIAYAVAVAERASIVATAVHAGDHPIYPDCRPAFIKSFESMEKIATEGHADPNLCLYAPFVMQSKADIVRLGTELHVPYELTWSCYNGRDKHCGKCGTCVERKEAFQLAGVPDPTEYE